MWFKVNKNLHTNRRGALIEINPKEASQGRGVDPKCKGFIPERKGRNNPKKMEKRVFLGLIFRM